MSFNPLTDSRKRILLILGVSRACSDSAGTTLCNNGDTCNYLEDLSGNGYHAVKNGTNLAPVYHSSGLGGQPYLDFSAGASLAITPDATLNNLQATHDLTLYGFGTTGSAYPIPGNGVAVFCDQCADASDTGFLALRHLDTFLATGGYGPVAESLFGASGHPRMYYIPASTYSRWGGTENAADWGRMYYNGLPCSGFGGSGGYGTPNTTGNIILGGKYFTGWADWRPWLGQWHGLCYYATSLSPAEVWQLDQYLIGLRSQTHPLASQPYMLLWDGNSMAGLDTFLVPDVTGLLGIDPTTVANFAWHFKTTQQMTANGGQIDALIAALPAGPRKVLAFHELTNDFTSGTAAQLYAHYQSYATARLAGGTQALVAATMLDQQSMSGADETKRAAANASVVGPQTSPSWRCADWTQTSALEPWNSTYYLDNIHPNRQGYASGAPYFATQILAASKGGSTRVNFHGGFGDFTRGFVG